MPLELPLYANDLVLVADREIVAGKAKEMEEWHGNERPYE